MKTFEEYQEAARRLVYGDENSPPAAATAAPAKFKSGRLKDPLARLEAELDFDELNDPILGPTYFEKHRTELKHYSDLLTDREAKARIDEGLKAGGGQRAFESGGREARGAAEKREAIERRIDELMALIPSEEKEKANDETR